MGAHVGVKDGKEGVYFAVWAPAAREVYLSLIHIYVKDILIPSEERKISMYPMDYEEFLWAVGDDLSLIHI